MQQRQRLDRRLHRKRTCLGDKRLALSQACIARRLEPVARGAPRAAQHASANGRGQLGQRRLGVAKDRDIGGMVLADLPWVHVEMDQRHSRRHGLDVGRKRPREQIAADGKEQVIVIEDFPHRRHCPDHGAAKQRMRGGKGRRIRHELRVNRCADEFRKLDQLGVRPALRHRIAGDDQGPLGFC